MPGNDCFGPVLMLPCQAIYSARFRRAANQGPFIISTMSYQSIFSGFFCSFLSQQTQQHLEPRSLQMKLPHGKTRFAFVVLFVVLAVNFMAAQKPLHTGNGDETPNGKHGQSGQITAAVPGPVGQAVVTGNGINYHGGPVLKAIPVKYLPHLVWQLEQHGIQYCCKRQPGRAFHQYAGQHSPSSMWPPPMAIARAT